MNDFIDLPHLPECLLGLPLETIHEIHSHTYHAIKTDRQHHDRMAVAHEWIRSSLGLNEDTPYRFDFYAQEIESLKADHQQRGEPVAYFQNSNSANGKPPQYEQVCESAKNDPDVFPLYASPQPAAPAQESSEAPQTKQRGDPFRDAVAEALDVGSDGSIYADSYLIGLIKELADFADYGQQPATPAQEPSDDDLAKLWNEIHDPFGRPKFRVSHVDFARALLARYGNHHIEQSGVPEGWRLVPVEPDDNQWGSLARDIIKAWDFDQKRPGELFEFLKHSGTDIPQWLRDEPEMKNLDHMPSKGTRAVLIYKAMLAAAPKFGEEE